MNIRSTQFGLCALLLLCCGCFTSDKVGLVEGVVTVDGTPTDRATVIFYPTNGRSSIGYTDAKGRYTLLYTKDTRGALIGKHKVTISTKLESDYMGGANTEARKETMPDKYLDKELTDLTANVERGTNEINFQLKSDEF